MGFRGGSTPPLPGLFRRKQNIILGGFKMKATKNSVPELIEKEVKQEEKISFFDRRAFNWFVDNNELKIGKSLSDFIGGKTENFSFKKLHSGDIKYWKLVETEDGKLILLSRGKLLK
jgi:hypothetical protein